MKYLPSPSEYSKYWYIDIETEEVKDFRPNKIWMMCASRLDSDEILHFVGHQEIKRFFNGLAGQDVQFIGHNAVSFDGPVLSRVLDCNVTLSNTLDTLVLSYLYDPALAGGHSLESWGLRLKDPKGDFHDFSGYSEEMAKYCEQDVRLGKKVAKALIVRMLRMGFSEMSCWIEHYIRDVLNEQQRNGWYFDVPGANALVSHLRAEQAGLEGPILDLFPPRLQVVNSYPYRTKKDGTDTHHYLRHLTQYPRVERDGELYHVYDWEEFNIGSPKQRLSRLLEKGYEPAQFTDAGNPKVDEESLLAFAEQSGLPEVKAIAEWLVLQGRSTMVEGWLNNVNYDDSCIHGLVFTCAATTRRMIHRSPNTTNIPKAKAKVKYGIECRRLWQARPGRVQVGYDASGLEMRMFAQYLNNPEATALFTTGDPHLVNTRNLGLPDNYRDLTVKNGFYAYLYGAGDPKLGRTLDPTIVDQKAASAYGKKARKILEVGTPGLAGLVADISDEYEHNAGVLRAIDGGYIRCTSKSAALNYKLQSAGAIVMKVAAILLRDKIRQEGWDSLLVGTIHDEGQHDVRPEHAKFVGESATQAIADAGEMLGFHVPLTGDYKIGANWAECH